VAQRLLDAVARLTAGTDATGFQIQRGSDVGQPAVTGQIAPFPNRPRESGVETGTDARGNPMLRALNTDAPHLDGIWYSLRLLRKGVVI